MAIVNPDPLRYPGAANTAGGTSTSAGASTESASAWIQQQPWYRTTLAKWGNPPVLTLGQRGYLARTAQSAGMNPDFGISTNGTVEDWSTPMGAKIALAAFAAAAGGAALGGIGGGTAAPAAAALPEAGEGGLGLVGASAPAAAAGGGTAAGTGGILGTAGKLLGYDPAHKEQSILGIAGKIGDTLGAAGQGAAQGRIDQTFLNQRQDQLAQDRYNTEITAPGKIASNSVRGDILANAQDFSYGAPQMVGNIPVPTSTGGLRPSIFSDNTRKLGTRMSADALAQPGPPPLTPMDEAGVGSSILNTAGAIGSFADLFNPELYKSKIPYKRPVQGQVT